MLLVRNEIGGRRMTNEEAIEKLREISNDYWDDDGYGVETCSYVDGITAIDMAIEALQERKTGKWVNEGQYAPYHGEDAFHCSLCGGRVIEYECQVYEMNPYCKWCGAKMEVDDEQG